MAAKVDFSYQVQWRPRSIVGSVTSGRAEAARGQGIAVTGTDIDGTEIAKWDHGVTKAVVELHRPIVKRYFHRKCTAWSCYRPVRRWRC
jgi:chemotaxis methyl-accepting protein methylase